MKYDGVTFVEEAVRGMTKAEFIKAHVNVLWTDCDKPTRKARLADVYGRITGKGEKEV